MFGLGKKGFRQPKKLNRKQQERQDNIKSFIDRYKTLCEDEGYQFDAMLEVTPQGVLPKMTIIEHHPKPKEEGFETKPWEECKKENEETRKRLKEEAKEEDRGENEDGKS